MIKPKKIEIVEHYESDDKDCGGDYYDIEVLVDGKLAAEYGDDYHDKGADKAEGFVEGINYAFKSSIVAKHRSVADRGDF